MDSFNIVYRAGSGEITEKKSRFIANVAAVHTEEEAYAFIESIKKKYWDARHNCHAFVIGERNELTRCSDDGEPAGTAGKPMLDVLTGAKLHDVCVVVTRYFGGVLLGTGGLVRAYSGAVQEGLRDCEIVERISAMRLKIVSDYFYLGKVQYILSGSEAIIIDTAYTDTVTFEAAIEISQVKPLIKEITEATAAKVTIEEIGECMCADTSDGVVFL